MADQTTNPSPIGPMDYVGDIHNILSPQLGGPRPESQTQSVEKGHSKVAVDPSRGTATAKEASMPSQAERLGARRAVEKNTHATHRTTHPDKERNVLTVPSSAATHRDSFNQGPALGYR